MSGVAEPATIHRTRFPHTAAELFYRSVLWGAPGSARYRSQVLHWQLLPPDHELLLAMQGDTIVGAYVIAPSEAGFLRLLLATAPDQRGQGIGAQLVAYAHARYTPKLKPGQALYGTIDASNTPSLQLSRKHYPCERTLDVLTLTRRRARRSARVNHKLLAHDLHHFSLQSSEHQASVVVQPHTWVLESLGDRASDLFLLPLLPWLLGTHRADYRFAFFHSWTGPPEMYDEIWSHALAHQQLTSGLFVGDASDVEWRALAQRLPRGVIGRLAGANTMIVTSTSELAHPFVFLPINAA